MKGISTQAVNSNTPILDIETVRFLLWNAIWFKFITPSDPYYLSLI
jgi:hypothetical protein